MKRYFIYIFAWILSVPIFSACEKLGDESFWGDYRKDIIEPYCTVENSILDEYASGYLGTRSLISQTSTPDTILCNFLRLDGVSGEATNWTGAYVSEGSVSTVPINNLRSIALYPKQPYPLEGSSRMVGWYPRTCDLPENMQGQTVISQSDAYSGKIVSGSYIDVNDQTVSYIGVKFEELDGQTDIMVSDVREGSKTLSKPFSGTNAFTFKHYLSAVRLFATATNSPQSVGMWGEITDVSILEQPTSCIVELPQQPVSDGSSATGFGNYVEWGGEKATFPIVTTPIFGNDHAQGDINTPAEAYPIPLDGNTINKYLGYSLVKPNSPVKIQITTTAGVYNVTVSPTYNSVSVFQPGTIYNVHLNFNTDGTIMVFLENEQDEKYLDLTSGVVHDMGGGNSVFEYKHANCYLIYSDAETETVNTITEPLYDGFCFDATVVGNGAAGIISNGAQSFYPTQALISPVSADIVWETSPRLVHQVELMHGYVRFKVAQNRDNDGNFLSYKEGNAVIAVYDENQNVLWSWHIWITDTPNEITYTEDTTSITVMDRNLGATAAKWSGNDVSSGTPLETYGLYYQWGRKDPSMGPPSWNHAPISMATATYYDYSSEAFDAAEVVRLPAPTLKDGVENPRYLILPTAQTQVYYYNWLYEKIDFLWGYAASTQNVHKTIYDPCPYGYRVSAGELADLFGYARQLDIDPQQTNPFTYEDYGQKVKFNSATIRPISTDDDGIEDTDGIYFPYAGYKGVDRGLNSLVVSWKYVGQKADYQSAVVSTHTADPHYYMHRSRIYLSKDTPWSETNVGDYSGHQIEDWTNRKTAASVRCVRDKEQSIRLSAFLTPDKFTITAPTQQNQSKVNFTIYAESFDSNLALVQLSVGYHMKDGSGNEGPHKEYVIKSDWGTLSRVLNSSYEFDFFNLCEVNAQGNATQTKVDLSQTTGTFRFVLTVKNANNINRISSTTITLASNQVGFEEWQQMENAGNNVVFIGEPVLRRFRIYGHSQPTAVKMIINSDTENPVDITANLAQQTGSSEYTYDYICSTAGLSFMTENESSTAYFIITFADGQTLTTEPRTFKVRGIDLVLWTDPDSFESGSYYVIQNIGTSGYIYDNGPYMSTSVTCTYANFFNISEPYNDNTFRFCNVVSSNYVGQQPQQGNTANLPITTTVSYYSTCFGVDYNSGDQYHTIFNNPYYWNQTNVSSNINAIGPNSNSNSNSNNKKWKIYKATQKAAPSGN